MGEGLVRRVMMTADAVGGVFTYVIGLGALLVERGVDVHVAIMGPKPNERQRIVARQSGIQLYEGDYRLEWMEDPWEDVDNASEWLLGLERKIEPDIVHLNGYCHAGLPWSAPPLVVAHSCVLSWWRAVRGEAAPSQWNEYRRRVQRGIHSSRLLIAPSRAMLTSIQEQYGVPAASAVIRHGLDPTAFRPAATKGSFILCAGRLWDKAKNVAALEAIAPRVEYPILLAGSDGSSHQGVSSQKGMQFLGELSPDDLAWWMARAEIYALPARYEPFGLSILEAALSGCALVVGDIPSLRELWTDAALFVRPDDHEGLESAIRSLVDDAGLRESLARRARERALKLRPADMVEAYQGVYEGLVRGDVRNVGAAEKRDGYLFRREEKPCT